MSLLFEYGNWVSIKNKHALQQMLRNIWEQKLFVEITVELTESEKDERYQPFLQFSDSEIKANNFVGFIQNGEEVIEIYPKVFRAYYPNPSEKEKSEMLRHIFFWFSYCRKWKFPFNKTSLDITEIDQFPELIINLIANQFLNTISNQPLTMYHEIEESLSTPRGSINFKRYINSSLSHGNFHNIECDYEPFLFDNKVNRIIKYCSRLLLNQTKFSENARVLQQVIFILDEVEDMTFNSYDMLKITLNNFFDDYLLVVDSCKLIINQQLYSSKTYDLSQWCLLFPMEYIFEDFVAGFLENKFSNDWNVEYQKSDEYLSNNPKVFNMQHDIFLTSRNGAERKVIIDTKYKLRPSNFKEDPKKGIAQPDLYQMVSYAFKRGCTNILLLYPNISETLNDMDAFEIFSRFEGSEKITITALEVPFWMIKSFDAKELEKNLLETLKWYLDKLPVS